MLGVAAFFGVYYARWIRAELGGESLSFGLRVFLGVEGVVFVAGLLLAAALAIRLPVRPDARALAVLLACVAFMGSGDGAYHFRQDIALPAAFDVAVDTLYPLAFLVGIAALVRFSTLFPRGLAPMDFPRGTAFRRLRLALLRPRTVWVGAVLLGILAQVFAFSLAWMFARVGMGLGSLQVVRPVFIALVLFGMGLAVANLRTGYQRIDPAMRRKFFWIVEGVLAVTTLLVFASAAKLFEMLGGFDWGQIWYPLAFYVALLVMIACIAIAMFFSGALDPTLAIKKTALVGLVGLTMVAILALTQQLVQQYLVALLGLSDRAGGMVTGAVVALTFEPVRTRLTAVVERVLDRAGFVDDPAPAVGVVTPEAGSAGGAA